VPLEASELAELRAGSAELLDLLTQTGEIRRKAAGMWSGVAGAEAVACLVTLVGQAGNAAGPAQSPGGAERAGSARLDVLPGVDLRPGDRVLVEPGGLRFECELVAPEGILLRTGYGRLEYL
jgi:hypothetical protein